jgi:saccharopine dehydrogenase-like NADP-dependent oxidoreductase
MAHEFEVGMVQKVKEVGFAPGIEVVYAKDSVTLVQKPFAQERP